MSTKPLSQRRRDRQEALGLRCPECGEPATVRCRCPLGDSACANGHSWHTCLVHGRVVLGPADHGMETGACRCKKVEVKNG